MKTTLLNKLVTLAVAVGTVMAQLQAGDLEEEHAVATQYSCLPSDLAAAP